MVSKPLASAPHVTTDGENLVPVVRSMIPSYHAPHPITIVEQHWPCWLATVLGLSLPIARIFAHPRFRPLFNTATTSKLIPSWDSLEALDHSLLDTSTYIMGSGSIHFLDTFSRETIVHCKGFLYAVTLETRRYARQRDAHRQLTSWSRALADRGLDSHVLRHQDFGGITNAEFLVGHRGFTSSSFVAREALPRTLGHVINAASSGYFPEIPEPPRVVDAPRAPVTRDGYLRKEGLFDVFSPAAQIACPSVFTRSGWVRRGLTASERLRMWDMPLSIDTQTVDKGWLKELGHLLTPLVGSAIL